MSRKGDYEGALYDLGTQACDLIKQVLEAEGDTDESTRYRVNLSLKLLAIIERSPSPETVSSSPGPEYYFK